VFNYGSDTIQTIPVAVSINNSLIIRDTLRNANLLPGGQVSHVFSQLIDMTTEGDYLLRAWAELNGELNRFNDTSDIAWTTSHLFTISQFPHTEDFKDTVTSWYSSGFKDSWVRSVEKPCTLPDSFGGFYTYKFRPETYSSSVCGSYGHGVGEVSWLYSGTCYDFGLNPAPVISLDLTTFLPDSIAGLTLESSIDFGQSWQRVGGYETGKNWYNDSSILSRPSGSNVGWSGRQPRFTAEHYLFDLAFENSVRFRLAFDADSGSGFYVRMSDFTLYELPQNDVRVSRLLSPSKNCALGSAEAITVSIINRGFDTLKTMPLAYQIDNGPVIRDTLRGVAVPLDDSIVYTFSQPADFSAPGRYDFKAWAEPGGYVREANDTLISLIQSLEMINQYPFFDDFEDSSLTWFSLEDSNSWALAPPRMTYLNGSPRGRLAWVTAKNLFPGTGGMWVDEESYLYVGNCFDLSGLSDPVIQFDLNWRLMRGYAKLEYTLDDGLTWQGLGTLNSGTYWYNSRRTIVDPNTGQFSLIDFWTNQITMASQTLDQPRWQTARHSLASLAGEPEVRFRFFCSSKPLFGPSPSFLEGFAIDNFAIYESVGHDASLQRIILPRVSCNPATAQPVSVVIKSQGTDSLFQVPLAAMLSPGGMIIRDTFRGVLPPGAIDTFSFAATSSTLLQTGYTFTAWCELPTDSIAFNDSLIKVIDQPIEIN
jgi:hypothetical protein